MTTRRHVLKILGATAAVPAGILALRHSADAPTPVRWTGEVLGALANLTLWHRDPAFARATIARMLGEIDRLENIFSLYRPGSEIARLNAGGRLEKPSGDFVAILDEARTIAAASGGAFNPAVQTLWNVYAQHFASHPQSTETPNNSLLQDARAKSDFAAVDAGRRAIAFARPGMALTLNGIAQGYITDRIAYLLRNEGFDHAMVELGETRALGAAPDGKPFEVRLMNPGAPGVADRTVALADASLSVSGGYGLRWAPNCHHIFDPQTGRSAETLLDVAVVAPRATLADGLSTAIFVAGEARAAAILATYPAASALITRRDGSTTRI